MKIKRWTIIEHVKIEKIWYWGVGIATHESGRKILVKHALPESVVTIKVIKAKKDYLEGSISRVEKISDEWLDGEVKCPHYANPYHSGSDLATDKQGCGWCRWQVVSYDKQLILKQTTINDAMQKVLEKYTFDIHPLVPGPQIYQYRNKIEFSFGKYLVRSEKSRDQNSEIRKQKQKRADETQEEYLKRREEMRGAPDNKENTNQGDAIRTQTSAIDFSTAEHRQMGFHKQWEFSKVVDVDQCFLVSEKMHMIYDRIKSDLKESGIPVYDAKRHSGCLRHLVIREWVRTDQILVNLAVSDTWLYNHPKDKKTLERVIEKRSQELWKQITTMVMTINNGLADIVHGRDSTLEILRWEWVIYEGLQFEDVDLLRFQVSPFSFFQTNTLGAETLFAHAKHHLGASITWNIIDLYCGSGTIGLSFLKQGIGTKVYGIEIVESAVVDAKRNAKINGLTDNCEFYAGKAEKLLLQWTIWEEAFIWNDLVVIDPPRSWLHPDVVWFLRRMKAKYNFTLLYISCNPVTMSRDMEGLLEWWVFVPKSLQWVDMFPQTHHVEVIGLMK